MAFEMIFDDDDYLDSFRLSGWHLKTLDNASVFLGYESGVEMVEDLLADWEFHKNLSWEATAKKIMLIALAVFN